MSAEKNFYTFLENVRAYQSLSIIGMSKNVGKTTTLNAMLAYYRGKIKIGLTSIGRDGEDTDLVTLTEKPKIYIEEGTIIASAKRCLMNSDMTRKILEATGINTPMGEIIIFEALGDGYVDLGGPSVNAHLIELCQSLKTVGCDLLIIDGALSRKTFASPGVTEATILATGASLNSNMDEVIEETVYTLDLLGLETEKDQEIIEKAQAIYEQGKVGIITKAGMIKLLPVITALESAQEVIEALDEETAYVVIQGAVSNKFLDCMAQKIKKYKDLIFLVEDGTKIFVQREVYHKFLKLGGSIKVMKGINVLCVTINPQSPFGYRFPSDLFREKLQARVKVPVFDVVTGG